VHVDDGSGLTVCQGWRKTELTEDG
jgi:hypothetical protein